MPVGPSDLTWFNKLHRQVNGIGHASGQAGIEHLNGSSPRLVHWHQFPCLLETLIDVGPFPEIRLGLRRSWLPVPVAVQVSFS